MRPTVLAVVAHPDDESFGFGGTLARYGWQRVHTVVIVATDGAAGQTGGLVPPEALAERRHQELKAAAFILGVETLFHWDYPDSTLADVPEEEIVPRLVRAMRAVRPHVVLTFGPEGGGNRHPDHQAISRFTLAAWHRAGKSTVVTPGLAPWQPPKLFFSTLNPAATSEVPYRPATARVDISAALPVKRAAFFAHRTQRGDRPLYDAYQRAQGPYEWYHEVTRSASGGPLDDDLFAGLDIRPPEPPVSFLVEECP
ncbi:MAG: PIG-L family deacetylase [Ardenticatenia bacterium]|nr:PIG-L family deacetylase [Ardenticatenia bacterium]